MAEPTEQTTNGKERRGVVATIFDPKSFPTLIPVFLAVASAFLTLDRMIHKQTITQEQQAVRIADMQRTIDERGLLRDKIVADIAKLQQGDKGRGEQITELKSELDELEEDIEEDRERLRDLERDIGKR